MQRARSGGDSRAAEPGGRGRDEAGVKELDALRQRRGRLLRRGVELFLVRSMLLLAHLRKSDAGGPRAGPLGRGVPPFRHERSGRASDQPDWARLVMRLMATATTNVPKKYASRACPSAIRREGVEDWVTLLALYAMPIENAV